MGVSFWELGCDEDGFGDPQAREAPAKEVTLQDRNRLREGGVGFGSSACMAWRNVRGRPELSQLVICKSLSLVSLLAFRKAGRVVLADMGPLGGLALSS